jgi:hypothetical protein
VKSISVQAAIFALSIMPVAASAATVEMCGPSAAPGPYDVATGDLFNCDLTFTGAAANGAVVLDFESTVVPLVAVSGTVNLGLNSAFSTATLEWFDKPSNISLGSVDLAPIMADSTSLGFGGALETKFSGPGTPDEQYLVLNWTGFTGNTLDVNIQVEEIAPVPLPAAVWLFLSAIASVGTIGRLRKQV